MSQIIKYRFTKRNEVYKWPYFQEWKMLSDLVIRDVLLDLGNIEDK